MQEDFGGSEQAPFNMYEVDSNDPESQLLDRSAIDPSQVPQINRLMGSLGRLKEAEQELSQASLEYMRLNETDMRALHYLIVLGHKGILATPGAIAQHLKISSASTTKLLDRLERGGHVVRSPHPTDRRALAISITAKTRESAMNTVGRQHAKRFHAAARLSAEEREVVIRFLDDMAREISLGPGEWGEPTPSSA